MEGRRIAVALLAASLVGAPGCVSMALGTRYFGGEWTDQTQPTYGLEVSVPFLDGEWDRNVPSIDAGWSRTDSAFGDGECLSTFTVGASYLRRTQRGGFNFLRCHAGIEVGTITSSLGGSATEESYVGFYAGVGMNCGGFALELRATAAGSRTLYGTALDPGGVQLLFLVGGWNLPP